MGKSEHYMLSSGIEIRRDEIEGENLIVREMHRTTRWRGKDWPTRCVRWVGIHRFQWGQVDQIVGQSEICDAGPVGISAVTNNPVNSTEEVRSTGQKRIRQASAQCLNSSAIG